MFDPSPSPSARSVRKLTGMLGVANRRAGRSPNFKIIHPSVISAPSTVMPTRRFLRYGDIKRDCLYSLTGHVAREAVVADHRRVRVILFMAILLLTASPLRPADEDILRTLRSRHPPPLVLDDEF